MNNFMSALRKIRFWPVIVPEKNSYIVQRFGKFSHLLNPGLNLITPFIDNIAYRHSLKQQSIDILQQTAITKDNVTLKIDGTLFIKIWDPVEASYKIENPKQSIRLLALTMMRSEIGKLKFDQLLQQRDKINKQIHHRVNNSTKQWGVQCLRYEILDIQPPEGIKKSMEYQVQAERIKRSQVLLSEGKQIAKITEQQGKKISAIHVAEGHAEAVKLYAKIQKQAYELLNNALNDQILKQYILLNGYLDIYKQILQSSNVIVGSNFKSNGNNNLLGLAMIMNGAKFNSKQSKSTSESKDQNENTTQNRFQSTGQQKKRYEDDLLNSTVEHESNYK